MKEKFDFVGFPHSDQFIVSRKWLEHARKFPSVDLAITSTLYCGAEGLKVATPSEAIHGHSRLFFAALLLLGALLIFVGCAHHYTRAATLEELRNPPLADAGSYCPGQ